MRVLHCINTLQTYGGAEKIVQKVICASDQYDALELYRYGYKKNFLYRMKEIVFFLFRLMYLQSKYDCIHFHLFPCFYFSLFINKEKVIIHEHNTHNRRRKMRWLRALESLIYKRAYAVICISESTRINLAKWIRKESNLSVIHNFTRFDYQNVSNTFGANGNINILMVASFTHQKRQLDLINALRFLPHNFIIHFVGEGPLKKEALKKAEEIMVQGRIYFHEVTDDIGSYYKAANLCILLSNWEGFGLVVVEAASFNRVTLSSNVEGLADIVNNKNLLINNNLSGEDVAKRIEDLVYDLCKNPQYYNSYCYNLAEKFSFNKYKSKLERVYQECKYNQRG
jgi:glycosyltransferase involved in cell wall biosynthesis